MTQEEKLEEAKRLYKSANADQKYVLESLFPELKESEDEKVRRVLREIVLQWKNGHQAWCSDDKEIDTILAWLEKQDEQNIALPKWKYKNDNIPLLRDSIILNKYGCVGKSPSGALVSDVWVIDYDELAKLPKEELEKQGEKKPADKVEPKFKVGDIVKHKKNPHLTYILKRFTDDGDYEFHAIGKDGNEGETCFAVVEYQDDWELVEPHSSWSEQDESRLARILRLLDVKDDKKYLLMFGLNSLQDLEKDIAWLKSLKDRVQPRPEQEGRWR